MAENHLDKFENFLLAEYSNIAQAHFKSIETISTFFRYYLLIMSIPISAIVLIFRITKNKDRIINIVQLYRFPICFVLFCISLIGIGVFCYITNLRLDAILYARVVNGIRKFFYDFSDKDINYKLRMRALPQSPQIPSYFEGSFFLPVVLVFGIINTIYFTFSYHILNSKHISSTIISRPLFFTLIIFSSALFLFLHFLTYRWYSNHREFAYLKSNILGVDIDGVLNKHREIFCTLIEEKTGKNIKPEEIILIPVHEHTNMGITREDERKVFNDPRYWTNMKVIEDASENIRKLKNIFKLKIYIFTYRPWPDSKIKNELLKYKDRFLESCEHISLINRILKLLYKSKMNPLKQITKEWLNKHNFLKYKLIFEKGNDYSTDPRGDFKNRFYITRKEKIRFFVEDDIEKAIKLSYICDVIFLMNHPYNTPNKNLPEHFNKIRENIPSNIIRVNNWNEIYQHIRRLS